MKKDRIPVPLAGMGSENFFHWPETSLTMTEICHNKFVTKDKITSSLNRRVMFNATNCVDLYLRFPALCRKSVFCCDWKVDYTVKYLGNVSSLAKILIVITRAPLRRAI